MNYLEFKSLVEVSGGVAAKIPTSGMAEADVLAAQIEMWDVIRRIFIHPKFEPKLMLLGVDPWPNRPRIQTWLDEYFSGLAKKRGSRVQLDVSCLERESAMDLLTNTMRTLPVSPSGFASEMIPQIHNLALQVSNVSPRVIEGFLSGFTQGMTFDSRLGSFDRKYRTALSKFLNEGVGRFVLHINMGGANTFSAIYTLGDSLDCCMDVFCSALEGWCA